MKTRYKLKVPALKGLIILCSAVATTAAFGQVTQIWTGGNGTGTELGAATNWGGTLPSTANNDTGEWNGTVGGNLSLLYNTSTLASGFGSSGINLYLNASQTSPVSIGTSANGSSSPLAITGITIDSGAGAFSVGGSGTANYINWVGRPAGAVHPLVNNSVNTATITPGIRFTAGGGATWTLDFSGTGNWQCNSYLVNDNGAGMIIQVDGPGTMTWNPTGFLGANSINSPIIINGGSLVLTGPHPRLGSQAITLEGFFKFNAPAQAQTLTGVISGAGTNMINAGTLTLSGQSTYTGDTILNGGEVIVNGAETPGTSGPLGVGTIDFLGGTLGFSVNNTFDYSARFSPAANQAYSFDTAGQNVAFTNTTGLTSSGGTLTKLGSGTLTLAGPSTYTGLTTVSAGRLVFQGSKSGSGNITVSDSTALGVTATASQITPAALTLGASSGATLEFNNVNSTTTALIAAGTLTSAGTTTININNGALTPGQSYPLLTWTSGSAPAVSLGILNGFIGNLTFSGNELVLNITATAYKWSGINNGSWNTTTANNWIQNGGPVIFANGGPALFDDTAAGTTNITINGVVQPTTVTVNNNSLIYSVASSAGNDLGGSASLTKSGGSTLTLSGGANTYTGVTTVSGGLLSVGTLANGGSASDIGAAANSAANLVLNGGTLQYTGGTAGSDHLFTLGTAGGTIDSSGTGALNLSNPGALGYSGTGARVLTLTGSEMDNNTLAASLANNGGATAVTKVGAGTWVLTGNNTESGVTTIENGELIVGNGGASGALGTGSILDNSSLDFNRTGTLTVGGAISGTGSVTNDGSGTIILAGNNSYAGGTTINAGTLQIGNGGAGGSLNSSGFIVDDGTFIFNSTTKLTLGNYGANVTGTGNVIVRSGCYFAPIEANSYTGWTEIDSGATFQPTFGNSGALTSSIVTNNGTLFLSRQDGNPLPVVFSYAGNIVGTGKVFKDNNNQNDGWVALAGTNTYTGGTFIGGGGLVLGDGITPGSGAIVGSVWFTNTSSAFQNPRHLIFNRYDNFTFTNNILNVVTTDPTVGNQGMVQQSGPGAVALTGNNNYPGGTTIDASTLLQVGIGGTNGAIGNGAVTVNGELDINLSSAFNFTNGISGTGSFVQLGTGTTTLDGTLLTYTGSTTVSNGALVLAGSPVSVGGDLDIEGGKLLSGATSTPAVSTIGGNLNIDSGTIVVALNKSLAQSNSYFSVSGTIAHTGGSLLVTNFGPALKAGDKFTLFSQIVPSGAGLTVTGAGATWANNLAVDGSITALTVAPTVNTNPPTLQLTVSGTSLTLAWPTNLGWTLQTNNVGLKASSQWFSYPGSSTITNVTLNINPANTNVYFRMVYTNTP